MRIAIVGCLLVALLGVGVVASGGAKTKFTDPTPRKEAIFQRFADEFVAINPGQAKFAATFLMGSEKGGAEDEQPAHKVTFKYLFAISKFEVTQELYYVVMGKNPSKWQGPRNSVEMVTWADAGDFCKRVTKELHRRKLIGADERIRLPSEAEWEYACRAGTTGAYSFGDSVNNLGDYSWYAKNSPGNDPPVGQKKANPWGLYDMHGYVAEWCLDTAHPNYVDAPADGSAWIDSPTTEKARRVVRGGSFGDEADGQRSAARLFVPADTRSDRIGFRCVKDAK